MTFRKRLLVTTAAIFFGWSGYYLLADPTQTKKTGTDGPAPPKFSSPEEKKEEGPSAVPEKTKLFVDWEKPKVALVLSGHQHGYVEPCGCTGLENQKGGLARRHSFLKELAAKEWNVVALDAGNQVRRYGRQAELQFQLTAASLQEMGYKAVGMGGEDLRLSAGELLSSVAGSSTYTSANVAVLDRELMPRFRVIEADGFKIGVASVLGDSFRKLIASGEIVSETAAAGLQIATAKLKESKCDYRVLMAYATEAETKALVTANPDYDLIVLASGPGEPAFEPETLEGTKSLLVRTGAKGMFLAVIGLFDNDDKEKRIRYQRVPLDDRFPDSPEMMALFASYQNQLKSFGLEGLGVRPQPHAARQRFVGSEACGECHTKAFEKWKATPHAHATDSIVDPKERGDIPRHFDPECLSCHVTGWAPQAYHPYLGGYESLEKTPHVKQNGCENCHGPGSEHVAAENGDAKFTKADVARFRLAMQLPLKPKKPGEKSLAEQKCIECHDIDNSPDFHKEGGQFAKYWAEVEHKGKD
jgi:Cytochrome c554 and c-prime